mmetsp:Transcript_64425/g.153704  ORF Transcript_64425/g.153704 Transcript_64425/m.153704 type:complete len:892 (+) Transcript_64425:104-2779(+)
MAELAETSASMATVKSLPTLKEPPGGQSLEDFNFTLTGSLDEFHRGKRRLVKSLYGARWSRTSRFLPPRDTSTSAGNSVQDPRSMTLKSTSSSSSCSLQSYVCSYWPSHFNRQSVIMVPVGSPASEDPGCLTVSCDLRAWSNELADKKAYLVAYDADKLRTIARGMAMDARAASEGWMALECLCSNKVPLRHPQEEVSLTLLPDVIQSVSRSSDFTAMLRVILIPKVGKAHCKAIGDAVTLKLKARSSDAAGEDSYRRFGTKPLSRPSRFANQLSDEGLVGLLDALKAAASGRGLVDETEEAIKQMCAHPEWWERLPKNLSDQAVVAALKVLRAAATQRGLEDGSADLLGQMSDLWEQLPKLLSDASLKEALRLMEEAAKSRGLFPENGATPVQQVAEQVESLQQLPEALTDENLQLLSEAVAAKMRERGLAEDPEVAREMERQAEERRQELERETLAVLVQKAKEEAAREAEDAVKEAERKAEEAVKEAEAAKQEAAVKEERIAKAEEEAHRLLEKEQSMEVALQEAEKRAEEEASRIAALEAERAQEEEAHRTAQVERAETEAALAEAQKQAEEAAQKLHEEESKRAEAEQEIQLLKEQTSASETLAETASHQALEETTSQALTEETTSQAGLSTIGCDLGATRTKVKVLVHKAMDMPSSEFGGKPDSKVVCYVADRPDCKFHTDVVKKSSEPEWEQQHTFDSIALEDDLEFEVWSGNSVLGTGTLQSKQFRPNGFDGEVHLSRKKGITLLGKRKEATLRLSVGIEILPMPVVGPRLFVKVVSAQDLKPAKLLRRRPQCVCWIPGKPLSRFKTPGKQKSLNPVWNVEAEISDYQLGDPLEFHVESDGHPLGTVRVEDEQIMQGFDGDLLLTGEGSTANSLLKARIHVLM